MGDSLRLGVVGAGRRGRSLIRRAHEVRDQEYLNCEREDGYPHRLYEEYATELPEWVENVSDLNPEISAILDPSTEALARASEICDAAGDDPTSFETLDDFLESDAYDAAIVASPNDTHVDVAPPLLARDVDTLLEKPLATTLPDHDTIIEADDASDAVLFVGFNMRSSPLYRRIKALLDEGAIGELGMIGCRECRGHFPKPYAYTQARSGGTILEKNCHDFDVYNWYVGADPVRVSAFGGQHVFDRGTDVLDFATINVEYENGVVGTLELCMYAPFGERTRMYELRGADGLLRAPNEPVDAIDLFTRDDRDRIRAGVDASGGHGGADVIEMARFLRSVRGEAEPPATPLDAKKAAAVSIAAETAVAEGRIVDVTPEYELA